MAAITYPHYAHPGHRSVSVPLRFALCVVGLALFLSGLLLGLRGGTKMAPTQTPSQAPFVTSAAPTP